MNPTLAPDHAPVSDPRPALRREAAGALLLTSMALAAGAAVLTALGGLGSGYLLKVLATYALGAALVWRGLARGAHPHARFGAANRITLGRLAGMALVAGLVGDSLPLAQGAAGWALIVFTTCIAVIDALDGHLARRQGLASPFGARFDMETDAAFVLVLSALVWQAGQAGPWVLAAGLMRYAFVAAAVAWPWLNGPLPPAKRRQTICVVQITALIVCLGPIVPPPLATAIAAISLLLLTASFAVDVRYLARHRPPPPETTP